MPLGFDIRTGERKRLVGGAGRVIVSATGSQARAVMTLPAGPSDGSAAVVFDIEVVTGIARQVITSVPVDRPPRPTGPPAGVTAPSRLTPSGTAPAGLLYTCETGTAQLVSGFSTIAVVGTNFVVVDHSQVPGRMFFQAISTGFGPGDRVTFSSPPWSGEPTGDGLSKLCDEVDSPTVLHHRRGGALEIAEPGGTLPNHYRREVVVSEVRDGQANSIFVGGPIVAETHQVESLSRERTGEAAIAEGSICGVKVNGPAARLLHEVALNSGYLATPDFLTESVGAPTPPPAPTTPAKWVGVLRTTAPDLEGERQFIAASEREDYPYDADPANSASSHDQKLRWLQLALPLGAISFPATPDAATTARFDRVADRRVLGAMEGLSEAVPAIRRAIENAQRFIYIETPTFCGPRFH